MILAFQPPIDEGCASEIGPLATTAWTYLLGSWEQVALASHMMCPPCSSLHNLATTFASQLGDRLAVAIRVLELQEKPTLSAFLSIVYQIVKEGIFLPHLLQVWLTIG